MENNSGKEFKNVLIDIGIKELLKTKTKEEIISDVLNTSTNKNKRDLKMKLLKLLKNY